MKDQVLKRDGRVQAFQQQKIQQTLLQAAQSLAITDTLFCQQLAARIEPPLSASAPWPCQQIQEQVVVRLQQSCYPELAPAYLACRAERDKQREKNSPLLQEVASLVAQSNSALLNENANKDSKVIPTQRDLLAGIIARHYAKQQLLPAEIVSAHERGELHYHDLDYAPFFPMFNCMLVDLKGMLTQGFKLGNADIEPPKSIATATAVTAQIIAQVASHIYGGTTLDRLDEVLAPYVHASYCKHRREGEKWQVTDIEAYAHARTEKECYDAFQALEYEVNTLHTANGQTPFVTFGFGLGRSWEARMIQQAILRNRIAGLGKNRKTAIFPKLVFAVREGLNRQPTDANYDIKQLALECASKRMYPDILNYEQVVQVTGSFKTPMGCRSFLAAYHENGELLHDGRCNIGVISLNLPRIALQAKGDITEFWPLLEQRLQVAKQALITRITRLSGVKARVAPILYMEGACGVRLNADDDIAPLFTQGRASISLGYIGLHETLIALCGNQTHLFDSPENQAIAVEIVAYLKAATERWQAETGYGFSLYSTPSENLCDRFCRLDRAEFGLVAGVTDKGYYTNSFHLDVEKKVSPYHKLDFEAPYPPLASGGFICYGEYPNLQHNLQALEDIWDYSYNRVPYYATNTPLDNCYLCQFSGEFHCTAEGFSCPACGNKDSRTMSVIRRVCGYLGSPDARPFNAGKQAEVQRRVKHLAAL